MTTPLHPAAPILVGREREQAALREALASALGGRGSLVLIGGEAGIGKTALAEWLLEEARQQGALVLVGRCYDLSETPPYGPWAEALARAPRGDAFPTPPIGPTGVPLTLAASQGALFAAARDYLAALAATRPLALFLDDLHWADQASLDLLRVLGRQLADLPILVLATYRADELTRHHPLYTLLPVLVREARAARLDLRTLDDDGLAALVGTCHALSPGDADRLLAYLRERTEGNPFYAGEVLRALRETGALQPHGAGWALGDLAAVGVPALLRQVIDARIDRLDKEARSLLVVAAVVGQAAPLALWAAVAGTDEDRLLGTIERAVEARLLVESPDGASVSFAHALIREALYEGLLATRRRRVHLRVGEVLAASSHPDPDAVAHHFRRAGDARAIAWLIRAADRAQRAFAYRTAERRYEAALSVVPSHGAESGWLHYKLARILRYIDPEQSARHLDAAARAATDSRDAALTFATRYHRALLALHAGRFGEGIAQVAEVVAALDTLTSADRATLAENAESTSISEPLSCRNTLVAYLASVGRYGESLGLAERELGSLPRVAGEPLIGAEHAELYRGLGQVHATRGHSLLARDAFATSVGLYHKAGHHLLVGFVTGLTLAMLLLPYQAEQVEARREAARAIEAAWERAGSSGYTPVPRLLVAPLLLLEGRWGEARALTEQARREHIVDARQLAVWVLAALAREQGDRERAWAHVHSLFREGPDTTPGGVLFHYALPLIGIAARLCLDAGNLSGARGWLEMHDRWLAWSGTELGRAEGRLAWATYHRAGGGLADARDHAERAIAHATDPRQPLALLTAHRILGELATTANDYDGAATHLSAALALADDCAAPYERALTLLALAELRIATNEGRGAATAITEARATLIPLEARPALARADALAAHFAAHPAVPVPAREAPPFGLTAREAEALRLVAQGLANVEIAARLHVSHRTIEQHLRSVYGKLGVENRTAATRLAVERGIAGDVP